MGSAAAASWKQLLLNSIHSNSHLNHSSYFQIVHLQKRFSSFFFLQFHLIAHLCPYLTSLCFYIIGHSAGNCSIQWQTLQSHRRFQIDDLNHCSYAEICWYFTNSWEQFRISGLIDVIDGMNSDPMKLQQREKSWFACSLRSRMQYLAPAPGLPSVSEQQSIEPPTLDPSMGPVDVFCLLVLDPDQVDYLNLKSSQRLMFTSGQSGDGNKFWTLEKVNP